MLLGCSRNHETMAHTFASMIFNHYNKSFIITWSIYSRWLPRAKRIRIHSHTPLHTRLHSHTQTHTQTQTLVKSTSLLFCVLFYKQLSIFSDQNRVSTGRCLLLLLWNAAPHARNTHAPVETNQPEFGFIQCWMKRSHRSERSL